MRADDAAQPASWADGHWPCALTSQTSSGRCGTPLLRSTCVSAQGCLLAAQIGCPAESASAGPDSCSAEPALPGTLIDSELSRLLHAAGLGKSALAECRLFVSMHEAATQGAEAQAWASKLSAGVSGEAAAWRKPLVVPALGLADASGPLQWALRVLYLA
jgi:hypothetical protein